MCEKREKVVCLLRESVFVREILFLCEKESKIMWEIVCERERMCV